jgi:hypothetical protein
MREEISKHNGSTDSIGYPIQMRLAKLDAGIQACHIAKTFRADHFFLMGMPHIDAA